MKYTIKTTLLFILISCATALFAKPTIVVVLMVKDEAENIIKTVKPYTDAGIDHIIIFDTGSRDKTQTIIQNFFTENNIQHAHIVEEPFIDFATSRNHALDAAQRIFPEATFMLMPDAEWYMHNVQGLIDFCDVHEHHIDNSYFVRIRSSYLDFVTARLIRCHKNVYFGGVVHEIINNYSNITVDGDCYFEWCPSNTGHAKSVQRWQRDKDLLLKEHIRNPLDPRTVFYLAETYAALGDYENAYAYYKKRMQLHIPSNEDLYVILYRLGRTAQHLSIDTKDSTICPLSVQHFLEAYQIRPLRAEPLVKIAHYYRDKNMMTLAFLYAQRACNIAYPKEDRLFVEKYTYEFDRYDLLGIISWYVGEYAVGEWAVQQALKANPTAPHLHRNLQLYVNQLQIQTQAD